jgi:FMN-dependent NADH-azoreductase
VGLAGNKRVIIASSRGGFYGPDTPRAFLDRHETYLSGIFGFLGISDVTFIRAEGVSISDHRQAAIAAAKSAIASQPLNERPEASTRAAGVRCVPAQTQAVFLSR